jgi:hypothetical protein
VNDAFRLTNSVSDTPVGTFHLSLGPDAPVGALIDPETCVLHWRPECGQANTTNTVTVRVTDSGNTNLLDEITFTAVVGECVIPALGHPVLSCSERLRRIRGA